MNTGNVKKSFAKFATFAAIFLFAFTHAAKAGLDSYEIYLNDKLIVRQTVDKPLTLESLPLDQRNVNDRLVIRYFQCNAPNKLASNRVITIRDASGNKIKEWKFADANGSATAMVIHVKDLLQLEKNNAVVSLSLFYTADGHPQGQRLTFLHVGSKSTTFNAGAQLHITYFVVSMFLHS